MVLSIATLAQFAGYIPQLFKVIPVVKEVLSSGISLNSIGKLFENTDLQHFFSGLGGILFPDVRPDLQASAVIATSYDPAYVKKVQNLLNVIMKPSKPLDVDGHYGKLTQALTKDFQASCGLVIDGWAGDTTLAKLTAEAAKLDISAKSAVVVPEMPPVAVQPAK